MSAPDSLGHKLFVTSKPWVQDTGYERTREAIAQSLRCLQLDYLDLFLIHQPFGDVHGSWRAMQDAYRSGKLRAIGVSNFQHDRLMDIIAFNDIAPAVNQIEVNPFHQQADSVAFILEQGVQPKAATICSRMSCSRASPANTASPSAKSSCAR